MAWTEVQSELGIDHRISSVVVGGAAPNLMVHATVRDHPNSVTQISYGPYDALDVARAQDEEVAIKYGIEKIYRVLPLHSRK